MLVCTLTHTHLVHKCNLFNMYNVTHMYDFRADHLALDNRLVCFSLEEVILPTLSIP